MLDVKDIRVVGMGDCGMRRPRPTLAGDKPPASGSPAHKGMGLVLETECLLRHPSTPREHQCEGRTRGLERRRAGEGVPTPRTSGFQLSLE